MPPWSRRAERDAAAWPPAMCEKARALIERLDTEPGSGQKLLGPLKGIRSARLGRSHRILYEISTDGSAHVLTIAPRKDAYR